ncbi:MAG: 2,3,4,5-tetrahydropyridine-2,6-dicarboxylate N-succinyltransferase, partial [uncultured Ramlibacter sp.]
DPTAAADHRPGLGKPRQPLAQGRPQGGDRGRRARRRRDEQRPPARGHAAGRRQVDGEPMGEEGRAAVLPPERQRLDAGRRPGLLRQGADQVRPPLARGDGCHRRAGGAAGGGPPRQLHRQGCGADAQLRQHRRLRRRGHDGRHLGHGGLVRAGRQERAPVRRRRAGRGAGAAAGQSHDHRGQLLHRRPLRDRRRRDRGGELGGLDGRVHRPEHADLRPRHRRGELRPGAGRLGGDLGQPAQGRRQVQPVCGHHREAGRCADPRQDQPERPAAPL